MYHNMDGASPHQQPKGEVMGQNPETAPGEEWSDAEVQKVVMQYLEGMEEAKTKGILIFSEKVEYAIKSIAIPGRVILRFRELPQKVRDRIREATAPVGGTHQGVTKAPTMPPGTVAPMGFTEAVGDDGDGALQARHDGLI